MNDCEYMRLALELAELGRGMTSPNPMVGAVIVKDGRIIGRGLHERYGEKHAERNALAACTENPRGAVMYVTLEPCCHYGKQPPCTDAIIEAGISRVVTGSGDPNPLVAGRGIRILRENGIEVTENVLSDECRRLNEVFFHYISTGRPFTALKYAMTLDGKIATHTGASKWVTGEEARRHVHSLRSRYMGIMVGVGTVIADNPMLNCRIEGGRDPIRIVCDTRLRTPTDAALVTTADRIPTLIATCSRDEKRYAEYEKHGCRILKVPERNGRVDIAELMLALGRERIDGVLVEGGAELNWSVIESGMANKVYAYVAPAFFGGRGARTPVGGEGISLPSDAVRLKNISLSRIGEDILIEGSVESRGEEDVYGNN